MTSPTRHLRYRLPLMRGADVRAVQRSLLDEEVSVVGRAVVIEEDAMAYAKESGTKVDLNAVDHNTFQESINTYLQGTPDDVFTWFAGYRMQYFAAQGLAHEISDVWSEVGANYSDAFKAASRQASKARVRFVSALRVIPKSR